MIGSTFPLHLAHAARKLARAEADRDVFPYLKEEEQLALAEIVRLLNVFKPKPEPKQTDPQGVHQ